MNPLARSASNALRSLSVGLLTLDFIESTKKEGGNDPVAVACMICNKASYLGY
jgi:hypothetical protein